MLTVNHMITASILVFMMAFSPMTISLSQVTAPSVAKISQSGN
jgi:hypothetical protein